MLPRVTIHTVISADGRIVDEGLNDPIGTRLPQDALLVSAAAVLASAEAEGHDMSAEDSPGPPPPRSAPAHRPLLVVVDPFGAVRRWNWLRTQPYWRDLLVVITGSTPADHLGRLRRHSVQHVVGGSDYLDVVRLLETLATRYGVTHLRVSSHGLLNRALLRAHLVDELSVVIRPQLAGASAPHPFEPLDTRRPVELVLTHLERFHDDGIWMRYRVMSAISKNDREDAGLAALRAVVETV